MEEIDSPLVSIRPVKTVLLVIVTGDRGLCGGYNNAIIRKVTATSQGIAPTCNKIVLKIQRNEEK